MSSWWFLPFRRHSQRRYPSHPLGLHGPGVGGCVVRTTFTSARNARLKPGRPTFGGDRRIAAAFFSPQPTGGTDRPRKRTQIKSDEQDHRKNPYPSTPQILIQTQPPPRPTKKQHQRAQ